MDSTKMKEPKTYSEQVQLLIDKGIYIKDTNKAEDFLSKVNYYKLSGYYLPYIDKATEKVKEKLSFEKIVRIYKYDRELSNLVLKAIGVIEIYLRTSVAYYHGHKYGAIGYENENNYKEKHNHNRLLDDVKDYAYKNRHNPVIIHHNDYYNCHYPIWVIIEFFSLGTLSAFYRDLLNTDKKAIAEHYIKLTIKN